MVIRLFFFALLVSLAPRLSAQTTDDFTIDAGPVEYLTPGTHSFWLGGRVVTGGIGSPDSIKVGWSFNNGPWEVHSATTPVYQWAGRRFKLTTAVTPSLTVATPGQYILKLFIKCSTRTDVNPTNDTIVKVVRVYNSLPPKTVLFEVMKFQGCAPCYPGDTLVNSQITPKPYFNVARMYIAKGEPLYSEVADSVDAWIAYLMGHPSFMYDRFAWPYAFAQAVNFANNLPGTTVMPDTGHRMKYLEPVAVAFDNVQYDKQSRKLTVKLKAEVFDTLAGDYRFNMYVTEDSVVSWQSAAPPGTYYHHRVMREAAGGAWGTQGSLPSTILPGQYYHSYEITLPPAYKTDRLRLIGFVQKYDAVDTFHRRILNSVGGHMLTLTTTTGMADVPSVDALMLYPNPATDRLSVNWKGKEDVRVRLQDNSGRLLREWYDRGPNLQIMLDDVPAGYYLLEISDGNKRGVGRFQKQ